jgi:hypothetical protein
MSKLTKSESARINGAKSHGPTTPRGLAYSSVNATRHGLTAKTLILRNEDPTQFLEMLNAYFDLLQPANTMEVDIISDIVAARWRLRRMWRYQTAILDLEMDTQAPEFDKRFEESDEDTRGAVAFSAIADKSKGYATAFRADVHLTRTYRKAVEELRRLRSGIIILQNEPTNSAPIPEKFSTEPTEPKEVTPS